MFSKNFRKTLTIAVFALTVLLIGGAAAVAEAFSVDIKNFYYSDHPDSPGPRVVNNYDFSNGTIIGNVITIPDSFVIKPTSETAPYALSPYPGNDIAVTLTTGSAKATLSTTTHGGVVLDTIPTQMSSPPPAVLAATTQWVMELKMTNFTSMDDPTKAYRTQIGMSSNIGGPHPEFTASWINGNLEVQAQVYDDAGNGSVVWPQAPVVYKQLLSSFTPTDILTLRLVCNVAGRLDKVDFEYRVGDAGTWIGLATYNIPTGTAFMSFPAKFPFVDLRVGFYSQMDPFNVFSSHEQSTNSYGVNISVNDSGQALYSAVTAESTGISSGNPGYLANTALVYSNNQWYLPQSVLLGSTLPGFFPSYHVVATKKAGGTDVRDKTITGYVEPFANFTSPPASVSSAPTFNWTWPAGAPAVDWYGFDVWDTTASPMDLAMSYYNMPGAQTSVPYNGKPLVNGHNYQYTLHAGVNTNGAENTSIVRGSFTYTGTGGGGTISFNGGVKTSPNWPGTDGMAAISGATVNALNQSSQTPFASAVSITDGSFSITGIPAMSTFRLAIPTPVSTTYVPVLSKFMNWNADIQALLPFVLFTPVQYAAFGNTTGTSMILGRIALKNSPTTFLSGATVTAQEWTPPVYPSTQPTLGALYPVTYTSGSSTQADGIYMVKNVPAGKQVQLVATLASHTFEFNGSVIPVQSGFISEDSFFATPGGGGTISFSGMLKKYFDDTPINGATIEMAGNASIQTTTITDGTFTLPGLPAGTEFSVKMTGDPATYVPTYSGVLQSTIPMVSPRPFNLYTPLELSGWGVTGGNGAIRGRVMNSDSMDAGYVSGATVTYSSALGHTEYLVKYEDNAGNLTSGTGTFAKGRYYILNVVEGDTVTVSAAQPNYIFQSRKFVTHAGAVSQGTVNGTPVSGRVAVVGHVKNSAPTAVGIKNATIEQVGAAAPINATVSNEDGSFYLSVPATTTFQLKFSKTQATNPVLATTYSANMSFGADNLLLGDYNLFPATKLGTGSGNWNITPGAGIIRGRVKDPAGNYLGGATVTAQGGSKSYQVCYDDTCATALTATDPTTGRYVVKNVDANDTVTVTAQMQGWSFNTRVFPIHADSLHQGTVTGTPAGAHPEAATIQTRFETAMAAFNANDFTGFASYVSAGYLDRGRNKTQFVAEAQSERTAHGTKTWTIQSITGSGDYAAMALTWNDGKTDTLYFHKEGGVWLLYGNQKLFNVWASSGHQMYSTNPYLYWVGLSVEDTAGTTITGVNVNGPGLATEGISLYHDTQTGRWGSWSQGPSEQDLGPKWATAPATPLDYIFTISYTGGTGTSPEVQTFQVKTFINDAPPQASLAPAAGSTATRPLTFSWGSAGTGYHYGVEVNDASGNRIWSVYDLTGTSVVYGGPALGGGQYSYHLLTQDALGNNSMISTSFEMPLLYARTPVTSGTGLVDNYPAWSPDGQKIAFTSNRSGIDNIWIVNPNGTGLTQLTTATGNFDAKYPSWSPDGTKIAYILRDPNPNPQETSFSGYFLYTMNLDGSGPTRRPLPPGASQVQADQFWLNEIWLTEWLDNDRIAFVSYGPMGGNPKLYVYSISAGTATQISPTSETGMIYKISWNAATGKLAYDRWPTGIQTMTDTGTNLQVLNIPRAGQQDTPSMAGWRTDGAKLAFVKNLYGQSNIGIFDSASGTAIVEQTATDDEWPVWSPDGSRIAFVSNGSIWVLTVTEPPAALKGDLDGNGAVNLADAIIALKALSGLTPTVRANYAASGTDVNNDGKVGLHELLYILQAVAGLRP